ncbi:MAG: ribonuclease HII [Opitutaceae bacterium]
MNDLQLHDRSRLKSSLYLLGVDEAGRGCLAGPVVAGACLIKEDFFEDISAVERSALINDSKQLSAEAREAQFCLLEELKSEGLLDFAVASGSVEEIAALNILGATRLAMQRAMEELAGRATGWKLSTQYDEDPLFSSGGGSSVEVIVDGRPLKPFPYLHEGIVKGDGKSLSIAMASIAAKVTRDRLMKALAAKHPGYGFETHKGYGTAQHRAALLSLGPCVEHRELFLRKILML